jgi:hypothetical protein
MINPEDVKAGIDPVKVQEYIDKFRKNDGNDAVCEEIFEEVKIFYGKDFSYVWYQLIFGALKKNDNGMYYDEAINLAQNWHTLLFMKAMPVIKDKEKFKTNYFEELSRYIEYIFGGDMFCKLPIKSHLTEEQLNFLKSLPHYSKNSENKSLFKSIIDKGTPLDDIMNKFIKTC